MLDYASAIVDTVRESMLVFDLKLRVVFANDSFDRTFREAKEHTQGGLIYEVGSGQWDIPHLRQLLEQILPEEKT